MKAGIALGSNIEPRILNLQEAFRAICDFHSGSEPVLQSKVYETSPVDCPSGASAFLNAVVEISTSLTPMILHRSLQEIEQVLGRPTAHERNSPRTIDLDLLYCDDCVMNTVELTLPHPRMMTRRFVLQPLADIRPFLLIPNFRNNVSELLSGLISNEKTEVISNSIS